MFRRLLAELAEDMTRYARATSPVDFNHGADKAEIILTPSSSTHAQIAQVVVLLILSWIRLCCSDFQGVLTQLYQARTALFSCLTGAGRNYLNLILVLLAVVIYIK